MTLPGKLIIGFLQEDNPQKFYFRVRPAFLCDAAGYQSIENAKQEYLEDGFIRIVPDKNELSHFKTRMRSLGRYCAIDLRRHPGENDKIRPNKNHNGENGDRNAYIVYSDVITALNPLCMAEIVDVDEDGLFSRPGTRLVVLRHEGTLRGVYLWEERTEENACVVGDSLCEAETLAELETVSFPLEENCVPVLMDLERLGIELPQPAPQNTVPAEADPAAPKPETPPAEPPKRAEREEIKPQPAAAEPSPVRREKEAVREEKPWLQSATYVFPRAVAAKGGGPREQSLAQQSGFNPKRGMSIKDIVDDMWRRSRFDQLGHPVVADTAASPVVSPVDQAISAMKDAWSLPEARGSLIAALLRLDELDAALGAAGAPDAAQTRTLNAGEEQLRQLEADRLKLLGDIDELKRFRQDKRTELLEELRRTHSAEFDKNKQRNEQLLATQKEYQKKSEQARNALEQAEQSLDRLMNEKLDDRLAERLLDGRAMELMAAMTRRPEAKSSRPTVESPTAGELISQVRVRFSEAGITLSNDEAVNLLACVTLGRLLVISGPCGSGKGKYARTLAASLGIAGENSDCFCEVQAQSEWHSLGQTIETVSPAGVADVRLPDVKRLLENKDNVVPTMLLIDEANRADADEYLGELMDLGEIGAPKRLRTGAGILNVSDSLRLLFTVRDSGKPLSGELLERAWLLRLKPESADTPWPPRETALPCPEKAVSLDALKQIFAPSADVPGEVVERMRVLREKLASCGMLLSRQILNDLYRYCSAVLPYMTCTPLEVLDYALAERAMPTLLATANLDALHTLNRLLPDMPRCLNLLTSTLPLPPL